MKNALLRAILFMSLLVLLFRMVDFSDVFRQISAIEPWAWVLISVIYLGNLVLGALRLSALAPVRFTTSLNLVFGSLFYQNFLPAQIGADGYKIAALKTRHGMPTTQAFSVALTDRYFGFTGLTFLSAMSLLFVAAMGMTQQAQAPAMSTAWIIAAAICLLLLFVLLMNLHKFRLGKVFGKWGNGRVGAKLAEVRDNIIPMLPLRHSITVYAMFQRISIGLIGFVAMKEMGLDGGLLPVIAVMSLMLMGVMLFPFTFNGMGIREFLAIALFSLLGFTSEQAVALSWAPYLVFVVFSLVGGLVSLVSNKESAANKSPG